MPGAYLVVTLTNSKVASALAVQQSSIILVPALYREAAVHSRSLIHSQRLTLWVLSIGSAVCMFITRLLSQTVAGVCDAERFRLAFSLTWQTGWRKQAGRRRFTVGLKVGRPAADASTAPAPPAAGRFVAAAEAAAATAGGAISASGVTSAGEAHAAASCSAAPAAAGTFSAAVAVAASPQGGCSQAAAGAGVQAFSLPPSRWMHPCDGTGMRSRTPPPAPVAARRRCLPRATFECCSRPCCMAEGIEVRSYVRQRSAADLTLAIAVHSHLVLTTWLASPEHAISSPAFPIWNLPSVHRRDWHAPLTCQLLNLAPPAAAAAVSPAVVTALTAAAAEQPMPPPLLPPSPLFPPPLPPLSRSAKCTAGSRQEAPTLPPGAALARLPPGAAAAAEPLTIPRMARGRSRATKARSSAKLACSE